MNAFNLQDIKKQLEQIYDVSFIVTDHFGNDNLSYTKNKKNLNIRIGHYNTNDNRHGTEFIGVDFWDAQALSGRSGPNDSMEEVIDFLDRIKLPRRTTPKEDYEQISLF